MSTENLSSKDGLNLNVILMNKTYLELVYVDSKIELMFFVDVIMIL